MDGENSRCLVLLLTGEDREELVKELNKYPNHDERRFAFPEDGLSGAQQVAWVEEHAHHALYPFPLLTIATQSEIIFTALRVQAKAYMSPGYMVVQRLKDDGQYDYAQIGASGQCDPWPEGMFETMKSLMEELMKV